MYDFHPLPLFLHIPLRYGLPYPLLNAFIETDALFALGDDTRLEDALQAMMG